MKTYIKPLMKYEIFTANEYVSACYNVQCEIGQGNRPYAKILHNRNFFSGFLEKYSGLTQYTGDNLAHGSACGSHTVIRDDGTIFENGKGSQGDIVQIVDNDNSGGLSAGDYVYWYTGDINGTGRYNHFGTAYSVNSENPNLS